MLSRATGETPFFLVYGAEVVLQPELMLGSPRVGPIMKQTRSLYDSKMSSTLRKYYAERRSEWPATGRPSAATTSATYDHELSKSGI